MKVVFVIQKKPFSSYETQGSILHSQELVASPDPEPDESISQTIVIVFYYVKCYCLLVSGDAV